MVHTYRNLAGSGEAPVVSTPAYSACTLPPGLRQSGALQARFSSKLLLLFRGSPQGPLWTQTYSARLATQEVWTPKRKAGDWQAGFPAHRHLLPRLPHFHYPHCPQSNRGLPDQGVIRISNPECAQVVTALYPGIPEKAIKVRHGIRNGHFEMHPVLRVVLSFNNDMEEFGFLSFCSALCPGSDFNGPLFAIFQVLGHLCALKLTFAKTTYSHRDHFCLSGFCHFISFNTSFS